MKVSMNKLLRKIAFVALAFSPLPSPILATELDDILRVTLRPGWRAADGTHIAAVQLELSPGWKTYWRQPGDTGIPPKFDFTQSSDLDLLEVLYPKPDITWQDQTRTIGYQGRVVFPIIVQPNSSTDVTLHVQIEVGVCKEICIPVSFELSAHLPTRGPTDPVIEASLATLPRAGKDKIICTFSPADQGMQLSLTLPYPDQEISDATIELGNSQLWVGTPIANRAGDQLHINANILTPSGNPVAVGRGDIITTLFSATSATEYIGCHGF